MKYVHFSYQGLANNIPKLKDCLSPLQEQATSWKKFFFRLLFFRPDFFKDPIGGGQAAATEKCVDSVTALDSAASTLDN